MATNRGSGDRPGLVAKIACRLRVLWIYDGARRVRWCPVCSRRQELSDRDATGHAGSQWEDAAGDAGDRTARIFVTN
jgi:hypothetical protein